jgi:hypothetical protein
MFLFPPAHTPLRIQSRDIRNLLIENSNNGRNDMFKKKPFCGKGHPISAQPSPHRICCFECKNKLDRTSYCCKICDDWLCSSCIKFVEHPLQNMDRDTYLEIRHDGKLVNQKMELDKRREKFKEDLRFTRHKLDMIVDKGGGRDSQYNSTVHNNRQLRLHPFTQSRPRRHLPGTPHTFFIPRTPQESSNLHLPQPLPLETRRKDLRTTSSEMKALSDTAEESRRLHHGTAMEEFARRTASRAKEIKFKTEVEEGEEEEEQDNSYDDSDED